MRHMAARDMRSKLTDLRWKTSPLVSFKGLAVDRLFDESFALFVAYLCTDTECLRGTDDKTEGLLETKRHEWIRLFCVSFDVTAFLQPPALTYYRTRSSCLLVSHLTILEAAPDQSWQFGNVCERELRANIFPENQRRIPSIEPINCAYRGRTFACKTLQIGPSVASSFSVSLVSSVHRALRVEKLRV